MPAVAPAQGLRAYSSGQDQPCTPPTSSSVESGRRASTQVRGGGGGGGESAEGGRPGGRGAEGGSGRGQGLSPAPSATSAARPLRVRPLRVGVQNSLLSRLRVCTPVRVTQKQTHAHSTLAVSKERRHPCYKDVLFYQRKYGSFKSV